jgi:hypothetical protein
VGAVVIEEVLVLDDVLATFRLSFGGGKAINLLSLGDCDYELVFDSGTKKRQPSPSIGAPTLVGVSGAFGDPHLHGPHGYKFDVHGMANSTYLLFDAPQLFTVWMRLAAYGPSKRFISAIDITLRSENEAKTPDLSLHFAANMRDRSWVSSANAHAVKLGARVHKERAYAYVVDAANGVRTKVTQMHTRSSPHRNYLNVEFDVPGCHERFDGLLGQLYHCKYEEGLEKFKWHDGDEEAFRVNQQS